MSMLAEPRRKQKVINLRAKNNAWSNDSNKFGQRMLEKMGWSSGKGLGARENGIVEHVVARYKNDDKGLGFADRNDQWTKNEDDFNTLLANLSNAGSNHEILHSGISLEKKSKKSKARIHYHKFTRGKDLSRYSEKDLANIFGKKSFKQPAVEDVKEDIVKTTEQVFTEKGNMEDYFKTKLAAIKSKSKLLDTKTKTSSDTDYVFQGFSNTTDNKPDGDENGFVSQPFSFYGSEKRDINPNTEINCSDIETKTKKVKKSKRKEKSNQTAAEQSEMVFNSSQEVVQSSVINIELTKVKKSKKKKCQKYIENVQSMCNIKESCPSECKEDALHEVATDSESIKIRKSKKKKCQDHVEEILPREENRKNKKKNHVEAQENIISNEDCIPSKKKKRKNLDS